MQFDPLFVMFGMFLKSQKTTLLLNILKMKLSSMQMKIKHWTFDSRNTVHNNLCDQPVKYSSSYIDCVMDFNAHIYLLW